jgi:hypothetical protein
MKIFAYRNLNRKGVVWSLKDTKTNLVIDRVNVAYFKNVELKVSEAGRQRVLRNKKKNVHAGVKGQRIKHMPKGMIWVQASYNPYKQKAFTDLNGNEIHKADYAILNVFGLSVAIKKPSEEV